VGARPGDPAAFVRAAAQGWAEWAEVLPRRPALPNLVALGGDRTLCAGDLSALAESVREAHPRLAAWLRGLRPYPAARGVAPPIRCGKHALHFGVKTYIVAIVNRTPASFSEHRAALPTVDQTVEAAWAAYRAGADIVDIGAESTEEREQGGIPPAVEAERLLPVIAALADLPAVLSVDTRRGSVAHRLLALRPLILNDVDALADPELAAAAAAAGVPVVLMHARPIPGGADAPSTIAERLGQALELATALGVAAEQCILDAGFGFGTTLDQDLEATRRLRELRRLGRPLLHAPSRKRTIGRVLSYPETIPERLPGTAAAVVAGIAAGCDLVRVHDVLPMARAARMADAIYRGGTWRDLTAP